MYVGLLRVLPLVADSDCNACQLSDWECISQYLVFYDLDSVRWEKSVASLILPNTLFSIHNQQDAWMILNTSSMTESEMILTGALKEIVWNR